MGEVAPVTCPNCHNQVFLHRVRTKKSVRLYFVPVVPYGTDEYLLCPVCSKGVQVDQPHLPVVEHMQTATRNYRSRRITEAAYAAEIANGLAQLGLSSGPAPAPAPAPVAAPPAPAAIGQHGAMGEAWVEQLAKLDHLHGEGVLSDDEFAAAKQRVLDNR